MILVPNLSNVERYRRFYLEIVLNSDCFLLCLGIMLWKVILEMIPHCYSCQSYVITLIYISFTKFKSPIGPLLIVLEVNDFAGFLFQKRSNFYNFFLREIKFNYRLKSSSNSVNYSIVNIWTKLVYFHCFQLISFLNSPPPSLGHLHV